MIAANGGGSSNPSGPSSGGGSDGGGDTGGNSGNQTTAASSTPSLSSAVRDPRGYVVLTWASLGTCASGYEIEMKQDGVDNFHYMGTASGDATSWTGAWLEPLSGYSFRIRADLADGTVSKYSSAKSVTVNASELPPVPQGVSLSQPETDSAVTPQLTFTVPNYDTSRYSDPTVRIQVSSPDAPGGWVYVPHLSQGMYLPGYQATITGLYVGFWPTSISVRVALTYRDSMLGAYVSSPFSEPASLQFQSQVSAPSGFRVTGVVKGDTTTEVDVAWNVHDGVQTTVALAWDATCRYMEFPNSTGNGTAKFIIPNGYGDLKPVAWNVDPQKGCSVFAVAGLVAATTQPTAPTELKVKLGGAPNRMLLIWKNSPDNETKYQIQRSTDGQNWEDDKTAIADQAQGTVTIPDVSKSYKYRVIAVKGNVRSAPSNEVSTTASFTEEQLAAIIYNETSSVRASETSYTDDSLHNARKWVGHVAINLSQRGHGGNVQAHANAPKDGDLTTPAAKFAWADAKAAAKEAIHESNAGTDPTDCALFYRFRQGSDWHTGRFPAPACRRIKPISFGPFYKPKGSGGDVKGGSKFYFDFWNDPSLKL